MKTLPLTVLLYDGPIARAYLSALYHAGYAPRRIVMMVSKKNPSTGKPQGRWLPGTLRRKWAEKTHNVSLFHWPRILSVKHAGLCQKMVDVIGNTLDFPPAFFESLLGKAPVETYCKNVDRIFIDGLGDPALSKTLKALSPETILFTGGGILPASLLGIDGIRFLHIHPGYLPHIRGADGLLWSFVTRGMPGASCFYMEPGIDVGDLVLARELPRLQFSVTDDDRPDDQILYRLLFTYFDPAIRARVLIDSLKCGEDLYHLPTTPQDLDIGMTFHFMHSELRHRVLTEIFPDAANN